MANDSNVKPINQMKGLISSIGANGGKIKRELYFSKIIQNGVELFSLVPAHTVSNWYRGHRKAFLVKLNWTNIFKGRRKKKQTLTEATDLIPHQ